MTTSFISKLRFPLVLAIASLAVAACGDDGADSSSAAASGSASAMGTATGTIVSAGTASTQSTSTTTDSTPAAQTQTTSQQTTSTPTASTTPAATTQVTSDTATLDWNPPTENTNGTTLTNLAGYKVYYGTSTSNLSQSVSVSNPGLSSYTVSNLSSGTWYFAVVSVSSSGTESAQSSVVSVSL